MSRLEGKTQGKRKVNRPDKGEEQQEKPPRASTRAANTKEAENDAYSALNQTLRNEKSLIASLDTSDMSLMSDMLIVPGLIASGKNCAAQIANKTGAMNRVGEPDGTDIDNIKTLPMAVQYHVQNKNRAMEFERKDVLKNLVYLQEGGEVSKMGMGNTKNLKIYDNFTEKEKEAAMEMSEKIERYESTVKALCPKALKDLETKYAPAIVSDWVTKYQNDLSTMKEDHPQYAAMLKTLKKLEQNPPMLQKIAMAAALPAIMEQSAYNSACTFQSMYEDRQRNITEIKSGIPEDIAGGISKEEYDAFLLDMNEQGVYEEDLISMTTDILGKSKGHEDVLTKDIGNFTIDRINSAVDMQELPTHSVEEIKAGIDRWNKEYENEEEQITTIEEFIEKNTNDKGQLFITTTGSYKEGTELELVKNPLDRAYDTLALKVHADIDKVTHAEIVEHAKKAYEFKYDSINEKQLENQFNKSGIKDKHAKELTKQASIGFNTGNTEEDTKNRDIMQKQLVEQGIKPVDASLVVSELNSYVKKGKSEISEKELYAMITPEYVECWKRDAKELIRENNERICKICEVNSISDLTVTKMKEAFGENYKQEFKISTVEDRKRVYEMTRKEFTIQEVKEVSLAASKEFKKSVEGTRVQRIYRHGKNNAIKYMLVMGNIDKVKGEMNRALKITGMGQVEVMKQQAEREMVQASTDV